MSQSTHANPGNPGSASSPLQVVCAVIENETGQFLSAQRGPDMSFAGKWEFPGGKVEIGEETTAALIREIQEELGCTVEIIETLIPSTSMHSKGTLRLIPFRCRITHGTPVANEHSALIWAHPRDLGVLDWVPADLPIVAEVIERYGNPFAIFT